MIRKGSYLAQRDHDCDPGPDRGVAVVHAAIPRIDGTDSSSSSRIFSPAETVYVLVVGALGLVSNAIHVFPNEVGLDPPGRRRVIRAERLPRSRLLVRAMIFSPWPLAQPRPSVKQV